jgi:acetyl-CoA acetyltransferase
MSRDRQRKLGIKPMGRMLQGKRWVEPQYMGLGPVPAVRKD